MDEIDRKILNLLQEEFPLDPHPFAEIGRRIGLEEGETLQRVKQLKENGLIRRIGVVIDPGKLNYTSTLCGVHVDEGRLMEVVEAVNRHRGVTHNYEREGDLNLWFTVIAEKEGDIEDLIQGLERTFSLKIYRFPKKRVFKIKTFFPM
ncbi:MAG: DNA-binding transcriptional regulator AsnC [Syntrophorhabdus sp. PtaB.Bin006]|nr:MAG: DNA-binding transcriptional regulator AsnC [Syntrophorhabdus sp. PtaB.Bin006]